ncbi:APC family permease [Yinghuangia soli]|uniref:APC family permease n=1 Tax=Yinghuangia soli TaxID=2908204 RepID=A0AA41PYZ5_9ACTN|nr:APC family permease [Yinghuangia soli]MCF2527930.1 APC family permease [Yinghuangia soli]
MHHTKAVRGVSPVAGLDRRNLPAAHVWTQSVSAVAPSAAMATTPVLVLGAAGDAAVWSVVVAAVLALLVADCVGQFARRMAAPGSLYSFTARGLGAVPGLLCAAALLVGYAFLAMAALVGCAAYGRSASVRAGWPVLPERLVVGLLVTAAAVVIAGCLVRGVRVSSRVALAFEAVSIMSVSCVLAGVPGGGAAQGNDGGVAAGTALALTAFIGFESAAALGAETRRPFRVVPAVMRGTVLGVAGLYVFATIALTRGGGPAWNRDGFAAYGFSGAWPSALLDAGLASSFFACALASGTALVRLLFCLGREAVGPRRLGAAHPRHRTPHVAVLAAMPVVAGVPCLLLAAGLSAWEVFGAVTGLFTFGHMTAYLLVCLAAPVFLRRIGELTLRPVLAAAVAVPGLAVAAVTYAQSSAPGADPRMPGIFGLLAVAGLALLAGPAVLRPARVRAVGSYDETTAADVLGAAPGRRLGA